MPLWFEIAVLVLLAGIALSLFDICLHLESINKNFCNFGTRIETVMERLEAVIKKAEPDK
jgi:hypothetical protein